MLSIKKLEHQQRRSALIFSADSSLRFRAGGNVTRMIVDNNGFVGIGTLTPNYQLEVNTNSACKPTSSLWTINSDERLKTIGGNYTKGLPELLQLNTIMYHFITPPAMPAITHCRTGLWLFDASGTKGFS